MNDDDTIDRLVKERHEARRAKDWDRADKIRKALEAMGTREYRIALLDEPDGTFWYWSRRLEEEDTKK